MKIKFYKIKCVTNLHVGSGDINYNIVDKQVERDPVNGMPIIHASGIKGALRDIISQKNKELADKIFGGETKNNENNPGTHKFLDAMLIARPMRVSENDQMASIPVTSVDVINSLVDLLNVLKCNKYGIKAISGVDFGGNEFLANVDRILIEGEKTGVIDGSVSEEIKKIEEIIGKNFAVAAKINNYDLPVVARNCLETGKQNLWYEEFVPHGSVFCFAVIAPDDSLNIPEIIQIGGNASIGYGICEVTKLTEVDWCE